MICINLADAIRSLTRRGQRPRASSQYFSLGVWCGDLRYYQQITANASMRADWLKQWFTLGL